MQNSVSQNFANDAFLVTVGSVEFFKTVLEIFLSVHSEKVHYK